MDGEQESVTEVIVPAGLTVIVVVPDFEVSWVEVAVIVTISVAFPPDGAVYMPELEIVPVPVLTFHVTAVLKLPVPITVAEHWLVPPYVIVIGEHESVTEVILGVVTPPLLLEPQPTVSTRTPTTNSNPIVRT